MPIDLSDLLVVVGVGLIGVGLWLVYPPVALVVVGGLCLAGGLVGARKRAHSASSGQAHSADSGRVKRKE